MESFTDEFILIHKNEVLAHWKNSNCDSSYFNTASMLKSWTSLVIGIMIDEGLIKSEKDLDCDYLPDWKDGCKNDVTVEHLLTMSAGINKKRGANGILAEDDMNAYVLKLRLDTMPNIRFSYSNASVQLLGVLIERVSGKKASSYFEEVLFQPLGMDSTRLAKDPSSNDVVFGGAKTTINDAAKFALLLANDGMHEGVQLLQKEWIEKMLTPSNNAPYYGYLWWLYNQSADVNYAAMGDFGQLTIVFPELDLIYLRRQSCNKDVSGNMKWMGPQFLGLIARTVKKEE